MRLSQVGKYIFYVHGTNIHNVRIVVTKKGNLSSMIGAGSIEYKKEIVEFLFSNGLVNADVVSLLGK